MWSEDPTQCLYLQVALANDGRVFVGDGYCNSRVVEYTADGEYVAEFTLPAGAGPPLQNPHSVKLQECSRALWVAEREASRVHKFNLDTRQHEGDLSRYDMEKKSVAHLEDGHSCHGVELPR